MHDKVRLYARHMFICLYEIGKCMHYKIRIFNCIIDTGNEYFFSPDIKSYICDRTQRSFKNSDGEKV